MSAPAEGGGAHGASDLVWNMPIPGTEYHLPIYSFVITSWLIMFLLVFTGYLATKNMKRMPKGIQNVWEYIVEGLFGFIEGMLGEKRVRLYGAFLVTLFLYILLSNYSGLLPGAGSVVGLMPPTANVSITVALAIIVFFSVFYFGIKTKGIGFFKHFLVPFAVLLPLNILDEIVRPVSLSLRLYGNIYGEEQILHQLGEMFPLLPLPMMALSLLLGAIQALVFFLLATTYIAGATEEHH